MKKYIVTAILFLLVSSISFAQSEKYVNAMKKNLGTFDTAFRNPSMLLNLANTFERIAMAEKTQWLPYYYAAFCQVNYAFMEQDKSKIDALAEKATEWINKADSLMPGNSEVSCIKSMIASSQMMVNPMQRYMEYGAASEKYLIQAMAQDPANPRPHYLKGQGLVYTPEQFGGGCTTAKPELQKAMDKFNLFTPAFDIAPNWGKEITLQLLTGCK